MTQSGTPQGRSSSPEASRRGQRPLARYLTPGLLRRQAPSGVNFPPPEGDRAPRAPQESDFLRSCHQRPARGPPRSIHNQDPSRCSPQRRPPAGLLEAKAAAAQRGVGAAGPRPLRVAAGPPPRKQQCTTGEGWGPHAARGDGNPRRRDPRSAPTRTRPLAPTTAAPAPPSVQQPPEGPEARPAAQPRRRRRGHRQPPHMPPPPPPCSGRPAAGTPKGGGAQPEPPGRPPRPAPRPGPSRAPRLGTHVR